MFCALPNTRPLQEDNVELQVDLDKARAEVGRAVLGSAPWGAIRCTWPPAAAVARAASGEGAPLPPTLTHLAPPLLSRPQPRVFPPMMEWQSACSLPRLPHDTPHGLLCKLAAYQQRHNSSGGLPHTCCFPCLAVAGLAAAPGD